MAQMIPETKADRDLLSFAARMKSVPRRAQKCDIYDTVTAVVDERHARNIFRKIAPTASGPAIYTALAILSDRLDERP